MNRETMKKRIAALLQKTAERGCTEAEALAAAEKAAQLMREYGLTEHDIHIDQQSADSKRQGRHPAAGLWPIIAHCTNTASIVVSYVVPRRTEVTFVGRDPGPQIATYLFVLLDRAVAREVGRFKQSQFYRKRRTLTTKRQAVADFTVGLVQRLSTRLLELFAPSFSEPDLETAHNALAERFPDASTVARRKHKERFSRAANEGWVAGANVNLAHGLGGGSKPLAIGGAA